MALMDLIGLGADKQAVIFDIGTACSKIGFAGEHMPRHIIATEVAIRHESKLTYVKLLDDFNNRTEEENFNLFKDFIHMIYFKHLLVNPKERRVVIAESMLKSINIRQVLAKVLFTYFEVVSVVFIPSHLLALYAVGLKSGLIVDCGYTETSVVPIYEQIPILNAIEYIDLAGKTVNNRINEEIMKSGIVQIKKEEKSAKSVFGNLDEKLLENIKVRCCFVGRKDCDLVATHVKYPVDCDKVLNITGKLRAHTMDVIFELNEEQQSIATSILDAILACPIDCRKELAENIVLVGGTVMMPGFESRLYSELKFLLETKEYKNKLFFKRIVFCKPIIPENYCSWEGAAMFGALETLADSSISREQYNVDKNIPDWSSTLIHKKEESSKGILDDKCKWSSMRKSLTSLSSSPGSSISASTTSVSERLRRELGLDIGKK